MLSEQVKLKDYDKLDEELQEINERVMKLTSGLFRVLPVIPTSLYSMIPESLWNFWGMPNSFQRNQIRTNTVQGRVGRFVCQLSHGTQQIKLYQPWVYKNEVNTPLRIRARKIMQLASQYPKEIRKDKVRELYRTMPYQLLQSEPVKLRLKNFYFDRKVADDDIVKIYEMLGESPDLQNDNLFWEGTYRAKKSVEFTYGEVDAERYYALNTRNNDLSNVLHFVWEEEIAFETKTVKEPETKVLAAEMVNRETENIGEKDPQVIFGKSEYADLFFAARESAVDDKDRQTDKRKNKYRKRQRSFIRELEKMHKKNEILREAGFFGARKKE